MVILFDVRSVFTGYRDNNQTKAIARPAMATPYQRIMERTAITFIMPGLTRDSGEVILRWVSE